MENKDKNQGFWQKCFAHPLTQGIAFLTGIFGVYAYYASIKEPDLTYFVSQTRTAIFQKGNLNGLSVNFQGAQITNDLSSAEIQIWNAGKEAILHDDILKPIKLEASNHELIYSAGVTMTRNEIEPKCDTMQNSGKPTEGLILDWRILEHNDCIKIQIIYGGSVNSKIILEGITKGQPQGATLFKKYDDDTQESMLHSLWRLFRGYCIVLIVWIVSSMISNAIACRYAAQSIHKRKIYLALSVLTFTTFIFVAVAAIYYAAKLNFITLHPPYGY